MKVSTVDVLVVGAGPAGLMAANALARAGIQVRIVDKRAARLRAGQADGIQPRTIEVFQSYGLVERLLREGNQMHVAAFYNPSPSGDGVELTERVPDVTAPSARWPFEITLHQGAIEDIFLDSMAVFGVLVERPVAPIFIEIKQDYAGDFQKHAVKVVLQSLDPESDGESALETVNAKFVIGADGAHSWVRKAMGIAMEGSQTESVWGVIDIVPETDFPDVRAKAVIHSAHGSILLIPREEDKCRFYIQLEGKHSLEALEQRNQARQANGNDDGSKKAAVDPGVLLGVAQEIIKPYKLERRGDFEWYTVYTVGQRVASAYSVHDRVLIVGDACHTHSPKAGQGMNASMADSHNLAWKLAQVLRGWAKPSLLSTYEAERRKYAQDLIAFDKIWAQLILSGKTPETQGLDPATHAEVLKHFQTFGMFTSGIGIQYSPSCIVDGRHQVPAQADSSKLTIGQRLPPQIFMRRADRRPMDIQDALPADTRIGIVVFTGESLGAELKLFSDKLGGILFQYTPEGSLVHDVFNIVTVSGPDLDNYLQAPSLLRPHWSSVLYDAPNTTGKEGGDGYANLGIDPSAGAIVVVRPDGHVATILPKNAEGTERIQSFFDGFLVRRGTTSSLENGSKDASNGCEQ